MKNTIKIYFIYLFIVFNLFPLNMLSQEGRSVEGTVKQTDGLAIPGVTVLVKGTANGAVTDFDGYYSISNVKSSDILQFSYVGMQTQEIKVGNQVQVNISLEEESTDLEQVVVIGYGTSRKKDLTGSVVSIDAEAIEEQPLTNIDQAIQGQVSGVTVTRSSGQPGGAVSVRVRGITSVTGSNEPLYIIDGVIVNSAGNDSFDFSIFGGGGGQNRVSPLSTLNPSDIESIQILKDASATAIYGSQASNGVVLITTKRGKTGRASFVYETYGGIQTVPKLYDMMDLREYANYSNEIRSSIGLELDPLPALENPSILGEGTNWQKAIFRAAPIQNHQLSVSGGKDDTKFYTSLNYFEQEGIIINTDFRRFGMRLNLDHKFNDWLKIGNNINFSNSLENIGLNDVSTGIVANALRQSPDIPIRLSDGSFGSPDQNQGLGTDNAVNPVAWSEIRNNQLERYKINGNFFLEIKPFKDLTFRTDFGYDYNTSKTEAFNPTYKFGQIENIINTGVKSNNENFFYNFKNYLTYDKMIGNHSINILLGTEAQKSSFQGVTGQRSNFPSNDVTGLNTGDVDTSVASSFEGASSILSYFTRINYNYDSRYYLSGSLRYDGSSKFAAGNRWGLFPSVSGAWTISEEQFLEDNTVISWLRLRGGFGTSGNQDIDNNLFIEFLRNDPSVFGSSFTLQNFANPDLTWESLVSPNVALELGFLENKIRIDIELYEKNSKDFLALRPLPSIFGTHNSEQFLGINPPTANFGEMQNRGFDFTLNTTNISKDNFSWKTNVVVSAYRNEVVDLADGTDAIIGFFEFGQQLTRTVEGEPIGQFYGYVTDGLFRTQEELENSAIPQGNEINELSGTWLGDIKFKDLNDDGVINDDDRTFIGSPHPDFTYSIRNDLKYGNFDLSIFLQGSQGNDIYNWTRRLTEGMTELTENQSTAVIDRYKPGNLDGTLPRYINGNPNGNTRISDRFVEDGSYLRIQSVTIGCTLPGDAFGEKQFFDQVRFYSTLQNLYTFTNYSGYDPEVGSYNQSAILSGIDNGRYPLPRMVTFGMNLKF